MEHTDVTRLPGSIHITTGQCALCADDRHAAPADGTCLCCNHKEGE